MRHVQLVGLAVLAGALAWGNAAPAQANGVPVRVMLSYVQGISNWGPTDATGVAEVALSEGEVNGSVLGLPPLQGEHYFGWLLNTANNETFAIGGFNTTPEQTASFRYRLPAEIPNRGWNLFLLSVERTDAPPSGPSNRKSLAGYFPTQAPSAPQQLPRTGTGGLATSPASGGNGTGWTLIAAALAAVSAAGAMLGARRAGRLRQ